MNITILCNIHRDMKIERVSELRKRHRNRKRTPTGLLCPYLTHMYIHTYSKYVSVTSINEQHQSACLIRQQ